MDVVGLADVDRDGHAGVGQLQVAEHAFAHQRPAAAFDRCGLRLLEVGQLHPSEGKVPFAPAAAQSRTIVSNCKP